MIDFDKYFNKEIYGKLVTCNAIKKNSFYTVTVHVNNYCNFNCNYCAYSCINTQNTFDFNLPKIEEYLILLDNHIDVAKPFRISLTGGEVSLYPNLIDLVRYIYIYTTRKRDSYMYKRHRESIIIFRAYAIQCIFSYFMASTILQF